MNCAKCGRGSGCILPAEPEGRGVFWEGDPVGCLKYREWKPRTKSEESQPVTLSTKPEIRSAPASIQVIQEMKTAIASGSSTKTKSGTNVPPTFDDVDTSTIPAPVEPKDIFRSRWRPPPPPPKFTELPEPYYRDEDITIYHGESQDYLHLLSPVELLLTDPPYGMSFRSNMRKATEKFDAIKGDKVVDVTWLKDAAQLVKEKGAAYIFTRWDVYPDWVQSVSRHLDVKNCIVWWKRGGGMGDLAGNYSPEHEFAIFATRGKHTLRGKRQGNVLMIDKEPPGSYVHPTQKPVQLMRQLILNSTNPGDTVLDPFMGSGTTLRAAKDLGRRAIGIEFEEKYCEVAVRRLAQGNLF